MLPLPPYSIWMEFGLESPFRKPENGNCYHKIDLKSLYWKQLNSLKVKKIDVGATKKT